MTKRWQALSFGVVFVAASAFAQAGEDPQTTAPEEEFVPWGGETAAPAPSTPAAADPKKKKSSAAPVAAPEAQAAPEGEAPPSAPGTQPEDDWAELPASGTSTPPEPAAQPPATQAPEAPAPTPPPVTSTPPPAPAQRPPIVLKKPTPQEFNRVSIYGAPTLGQFKRGFGAYLGFPLLGLKAGIGLVDGLDAGIGFDSFYGVMNEPRAWLKLQVLNDTNWTAAVQLEAGAAFFTQRPEVDLRGARWLTGRRNYNVEPGAVFSYRGNSPQSARLFLDVRYHLSLDTQPYAKDPLGGVPPPVVLGHNVPVRLGAEMPFSPSTSFLFIFGFDVHGRAEDSRFMPVVSVGLVTGL